MERPDARSLPGARGAVVFEDVTFSYGRGGPTVERVSFRAEPGLRVKVVRVAVIDSGVCPGHPHVMGVDDGVAITPAGEDADYVDRIGHGTAVAGAIREEAPRASLIAVKVFDRTLAGSVSPLVRAIDWAVDHDCHVINMSLGTSRVERHGRLQPGIDRSSPALVTVATWSSCWRQIAVVERLI